MSSPAQAAPGSPSPRFWFDQTSSDLVASMTRYLADSDLHADDVHTIREYLVRWIDWPGHALAGTISLETLRRRARKIDTRRDLDVWLADAICDGRDPL